MATPRFNLRNASLYLTKLKNKYHKSNNNNEEENIYDNTFIDEEDELTSNPSIRKLSSKKIDFPNTDRFETDNIAEIKQPQRPDSPEPIPILESKQSQQQTKQTEFCDLIVIKYLEETLDIYKGDLEILQHNRENLQQEIYFIGKKIGKIHELAVENVAMKIEIDELNANLKDIIAQYHESNQRVFRQKLAVSKIFHKYQNKLKNFLLYKKNESDSESYIKPDCQSAAYIDEYTAFLNFKKEQSIIIEKTLMNSDLFQKQKIVFAQSVFEGKQKVYLHQQTQKAKQKQLPKLEQKVQGSDVKKEKKVVLYDEFTPDEEQSEKNTKLTDSKPKKLSEAEKNLLLGDLKNFSKSFKLSK